MQAVIESSVLSTTSTFQYYILVISHLSLTPCPLEHLNPHLPYIWSPPQVQRTPWTLGLHPLTTHIVDSPSFLSAPKSNHINFSIPLQIEESTRDICRQDSCPQPSENPLKNTPVQSRTICPPSAPFCLCPASFPDSPLSPGLTPTLAIPAEDDTILFQDHHNIIRDHHMKHTKVKPVEIDVVSE